MQHPPESMGGSLNSANAIWLDIRLTAIAAAPAAAMLCQEGRWATQSTDTHSLWCVSLTTAIPSHRQATAAATRWHGSAIPYSPEHATERRPLWLDAFDALARTPNALFCCRAILMMLSDGDQMRAVGSQTCLT